MRTKHKWWRLDGSELVFVDDDGSEKRGEGLCLMCGARVADVNHSRLAGWAKRYEFRRRPPPLTCSETCRRRLLSAPNKADRTEPWIRNDIDGIAQGGIHIGGRL